MYSRSNIITALRVLAVAIIIGMGFGWLGSRNIDTGQKNIEEKESDPASVSFSREGNIAISTIDSHPTIEKGKPRLFVASTQTGQKTLRDGQQEISDILVQDCDVTQKSRELVALFPKLAGSDQVEAARHLANLLSDEDYPMLGVVLTSSETSDEASEILLDDLLNRANSIKVPMILAVAKHSRNPLAANAKDLLERVLGDDYGNDWNTWETAAKEWLEENPD